PVVALGFSEDFVSHFCSIHGEEHSCVEGSFLIQRWNPRSIESLERRPRSRVIAGGVEADVEPSSSFEDRWIVKIDRGFSNQTKRHCQLRLAKGISHELAPGSVVFQYLRFWRLARLGIMKGTLKVFFVCQII